MHKFVLIDFTHQIQKEFSRFNHFYACSVKKRFGQKNAISFIITYREKNRKHFFFSYEWRTRSNLNFPFFLLLRAFFAYVPVAAVHSVQRYNLQKKCKTMKKKFSKIFSIIYNYFCLMGPEEGKTSRRMPI